MAFEMTKEERVYLRELARKQAEYASLPIMGQRKKMWYELNDGVSGARPPVIIESWTFNRDFMPDGLIKCKSSFARGIEWNLLVNIRNHELLDDDKVIPDRFEMSWDVKIDPFGLKIQRETVKDFQGYNVGFQIDHPVKDLKTDLTKLKPVQCSVDRDSTLARKAFLDDLFGDILPVEIRPGPYADTFLTSRVVELMGMEAFFLAMYDMPDEVHRLMRFLADNSLRMVRWAQSEGLLRLNNQNQVSFGSSYNFTTKLPDRDFSGGPAKYSDLWGSANSQETVGIAQEMFHEFCAPYYREVCEPFGMLYWGCCEPAHPFWEDIRQFPHLRKVSISRWCDEQFMGEALKGTPIVFSRKPDPNFLGVDVKLNEEAWRAHIRKSLDATKGTLVEFIIRDVYTLHGDLNKGKRAVQIAREEIDRHR